MRRRPNILPGVGQITHGSDTDTLSGHASRRVAVVFLANNRYWSSDPGHFTEIVLADPDFGKARRVELVFGGDVYQRIILGGVLRSPGLPIAQRSIFGYVVSGACNV